jgi:hypothetical protein
VITSRQNEKFPTIPINIVFRVISHVTLTGTAKNQAQKELTTEYAKDVEGVKDVDNQMVVVESKTTPQSQRGGCFFVSMECRCLKESVMVG